MLKETYRLHQKLKKEIPFSTVISIFLNEDFLCIQTRFRKNKVPYYFSYSFTEEEIITKNEKLISCYVNEIKNFYLNANEEDLSSNIMLDQTTIENSTPLKENTND